MPCQGHAWPLRRSQPGSITINFAPALSATAQDIDDILAATRRALEKLSA